MAHRAIADLLRQIAGDGTHYGSVTGELALATADRLLSPPSVETRAHRQVLAGAVCNYFWHLLPPPSWSFLASERRLSRGRVDVLWQDGGGRVLIDEIKTGRFEWALAGTAAQAERYLAAGGVLFGDGLVGVRVLCLDEPARSWLVRAGGGGPLALAGTPYVRAPSGWTRQRVVPGQRPIRSLLAGRPVRGARGPPRRVVERASVRPAG